MDVRGVSFSEEKAETERMEPVAECLEVHDHIQACDRRGRLVHGWRREVSASIGVGRPRGVQEVVKRSKRFCTYFGHRRQARSVYIAVTRLPLAHSISQGGLAPSFTTNLSETTTTIQAQAGGLRRCRACEGRARTPHG